MDFEVYQDVLSIFTVGVTYWCPRCQKHVTNTNTETIPFCWWYH